VSADQHETEDAHQRLNRELIELLNELRVILPGVQVLFAFLLTLPFASRFTELSRVDRDLYLVALLLTVLASIILTTPSAYHRFLFRRHAKAELLEISNRLAVLGLSVLALAMSCALFVITDFLLGAVAASVVTAVAGGLFVLFWYALPLHRRARLRAEAAAELPGALTAPAD
jgi:O-antigen/teichoic acid export membrane protein